MFIHVWIIAIDISFDVLTLKGVFPIRNIVAGANSAFAMIMARTG